MSGLSLSNSPVKLSTFGWNNRLAFLYGALRTRSHFARVELEHLAAKSTRAKLDLAWLICNQAMHESDLQHAMNLYLEVLETNGWRTFTHQHRADLAILAMKLGNLELATQAAGKQKNLYALVKNLLPKHLPTIPMQGIQEAMHATLFAAKDYSVASQFLKVDIANPLRGRSHTDAQKLVTEENTKNWLKKLSAELLSNSIEPLEFAKPIAKWQSPFDLLTASAKPASVQGRKVTVVMSSFKPDQSIYTAVHSTLNQTYKNLELLIIDDCSPSEFDAIYRELEKLDGRIRVLRQAANGGTYRIRNRALDEATGDFITFQDSDDYMHPRRIELQVRDLEKHPEKMANISLSTRLTDRLEAIETNRRLRIGICEPALMFRRVEVRDRIGYFDNVRKSADSEYRKRIMKAYGQDLTAVHPFKILTVQRADNGGLTQGELGFRWITEFRLIYRDGYLHFHRTAKNLDWHISKNDDRNFYAPRQSLMPSAQARAKRNFDLVLIANLRDANQISTVIQKVEAAHAAKQKVALLQINSLYPLNRKMGSIKSQIVEVLNAGKAEMVFVGDEVEANELQLLCPSTFATSYSGQPLGFEFKKLSIENAPEGFKAEPEKPLLDQMLKLAKLA